MELGQIVKDFECQTEDFIFDPGDHNKHLLGDDNTVRPAP